MRIATTAWATTALNRLGGGKQSHEVAEAKKALPSWGHEPGTVTRRRDASARQLVDPMDLRAGLSGVGWPRRVDP